MPVVALLLAVGIGVLLGVLGGGGGILLVPLLKYVAGLETRAAIALSLLIVGPSALLALVGHARAGNVHARVGAVFAATGVLGAYGGGRLARYVPEPLLLSLFGAMMVFTAVALYRCRRCDDAVPAATGKTPGRGALLLQGLGVGALTGLVGVGGGFLLVPALTLFARVPTRTAAGTSLLVMAANAFAGFAGHASDLHVPPGWAAALVGLTAVASLGGGLLSARVPQRGLRRGFAAVVLAVGLVGFLGPGLKGLPDVLGGLTCLTKGK
jgi:uncharacterized membrane protein YfcA